MPRPPAGYSLPVADETEPRRDEETLKILETITRLDRRLSLLLGLLALLLCSNVLIVISINSATERKLDDSVFLATNPLYSPPASLLTSSSATASPVPTHSTSPSASSVSPLHPVLVHFQLSIRNCHPDVTLELLSLASVAESFIDPADPRTIDVKVVQDLLSYGGNVNLANDVLNRIKTFAQTAPPQMRFRFLTDTETGNRRNDGGYRKDAQPAYKDTIKECHASPTCEFVLFVEDDWFFIPHAGVTLSNYIDTFHSSSAYNSIQIPFWFMDQVLVGTAHEPCVECIDTPIHNLPLCHTSVISNNPTIIRASWLADSPRLYDREAELTDWMHEEVFGSREMFHHPRYGADNGKCVMKNGAHPPRWRGTMFLGPYDTRQHWCLHLNGRTFNVDQFWNKQFSPEPQDPRSYAADHLRIIYDGTFNWVDFSTRTIRWPKK